MSKFEWDATDSAPSGYPMRIISGDLVFPDGGSLYIPTASSLSNGWGSPVSSHVVGDLKKPLPNKLEITFYSYLEDAFYQGSFELPYAAIEEHFKNGYYSFSSNENITYQRIVTGIAPGGYVSVWLRGPARQVLVFSARASKADIPWSVIVDDPDISRSDYVHEMLVYEIGAERLAKIRELGIPFDLWESYAKKYRWEPVLNTTNAPKLISNLKFFNGEKYPLFLGANANKDIPMKPIPQQLGFYWRDKMGNVMVVELTFDQQEIFTAFNKLHSCIEGGGYLELVVNAELGGKLDKVEAGLRYGDEKILFNKVKAEYWGADLPPETVKLLW